MKRLFGTDGIRGYVGKIPMTPDSISRLAYSIGKFISLNSSNNKVLIGRDTRISGEMLTHALVSGLLYSGIDIYNLGIITTPSITFLMKKEKAAAGIIISASHNPYYDNGIKIFYKDGLKLSVKDEIEIEKIFMEDSNLNNNPIIGNLVNKECYIDIENFYLKICKKKLDYKKLKVVLDCANGSTYEIAPNIFRKIGVNLIPININPDGKNINLNCGSTNINSLIEKVKIEKADIGIAFDGDGDRVLLCDKNGNLVEGDSIIYIIIKYFLYQKNIINTVVGTVMTNFGLEKKLKDMGIKLIRTPVGDKYVLEKLIENDLIIGGENSGHIISMIHNSTGDGIIAALLVINAILEMNKNLNELVSDLNLSKQVLININVDDKDRVMKSSIILDALKSYEREICGLGRILLRASGTENKIRLMVEGDDEELIQRIAKDLSLIIDQENRNA